MKTIAFIIIISLVSLNLFSQSLTVSLGSIPATAAGQCTGKAWVNVAGGIAPYSFIWSTGDTTTYIENLCLGTYIVTVTDAANTISEDTVIFTQSSQIIVPLSCSEGHAETLYGLCSGNVTPMPYDGVAPYHIQLFNASTGLLINEESSLSNFMINNLCAGNYYYVMTDANNAICFRNFFITNNYINIETAFQGGFMSYLVSQPISIRIAGVSPINVNIIGSGTTQNYTVANSNELIVFTPNATGNYTIYLTDNNGNTDQEIFCVYVGSSMTLSTQNPVNGCDGAIISQGNNDFSISYVVPNSEEQITVLNGQLCPGTYNVITTDFYCSSVAYNQSVTITGPQFNYPELNIHTINTTCYDLGMAWVEATSGTAPYTYQWTGMGIQSNSELVEDLCAGTYFIKVLDAANVWAIRSTYVGVDPPEEEIVPGDTIWATQDTCILNIDEVYIYSYTVNATTIDITWAIVQNSVVSYLEVSYDYTITLPGTYNVGLLINCSNSKSLITLNATVQITLLGISSLEINEISLYPNPAVENLNLSLNKNVSSFDVMSVSGAILNTYKVKGSQMTINVSTLAEGVYFIRFTNNDGSSFVKKFVK